MTKAYFKIPVHEDDPDIMSVIIPKGKFRFRVYPMGLNRSSCIFNMVTNTSTAEIEKVYKQIDDNILAATNFEDALQRAIRMFDNFKKFNIKISKKEFQC